METENKKKMNKSKKTAIILAVILLLLAVAASFAYYFAILKGENINTAKMSGASLSYTEPKEGIITEQMTDEAGMSSSKTYDFSTTGNSTGTADLDYAIYLEEVEGSTITADKIKVYLTDENDIPINVGDYDVLEMGEELYAPNSEYLFSYTLGYSGESSKKSVGMDMEDGSQYDGDIINYIIGEKLKSKVGDNIYVKHSFVTDRNNMESSKHYVCAKYEVTTNNDYTKLGLVDNSNCQNTYEIVNYPKPSLLTDLNNSQKEGFESITNVIKYDSYKFIEGKISTDIYNIIDKARNNNNTRNYKLRYWISNDVTNESGTNKEINPSTTDKKHQADFSSDGVYKFKVNVYAKQTPAVTEDENPV